MSMRRSCADRSRVSRRSRCLRAQDTAHPIRPDRVVLERIYPAAGSRRDEAEEHRRQSRAAFENRSLRLPGASEKGSNEICPRRHGPIAPTPDEVSQDPRRRIGRIVQCEQPAHPAPQKDGFVSGANETARAIRDHDAHEISYGSHSMLLCGYILTCATDYTIIPWSSGVVFVAMLKRALAEGLRTRSMAEPGL